jgi:hypothetical protein
MILRLKIITPIDKPKELYKGSFNQLSIDEGFLLFHTHTYTESIILLFDNALLT